MQLVALRRDHGTAERGFAELRTHTREVERQLATNQETVAALQVRGGMGGGEAF